MKWIVNRQIKRKKLRLYRLKKAEEEEKDLEELHEALCKTAVDYLRSVTGMKANMKSEIKNANRRGCTPMMKERRVSANVTPTN